MNNDFSLELADYLATKSTGAFGDFGDDNDVMDLLENEESVLSFSSPDVPSGSSSSSPVTHSPWDIRTSVSSSGDPLASAFVTSPLAVNSSSETILSSNDFRHTSFTSMMNDGQPDALRESTSSQLSPTPSVKDSGVLRKKRKVVEISDENSQSLVWENRPMPVQFPVYSQSERLDVVFIPNCQGNFLYCPDEDAMVNFKRNQVSIKYSLRISTPGGDEPRSPLFIQNMGAMVPIAAFEAMSYVLALQGDDSRIIKLVMRGKTRKLNSKALSEISPVTITPGGEASHHKIYFSESTNRRPGKAMQAKEYYYLVSSLVAVDGKGNKYPVAELITGAIVIRSSSPGFYKEEAKSPTIDREAIWNENDQGDVTIHNRKVGINTDSPVADLTVGGDLALTGNMYRPSDKRIKSNFKPVDKDTQLENIRKIKLYDYDKKDPVTGELSKERGVIAQEMKEILPEGVKNVKMITKDGEYIDDFHVVNDRSLLVENLGATQALDEDVRDLDNRVTNIESRPPGQSQTINIMSPMPISSDTRSNYVIYCSLISILLIALVAIVTTGIVVSIVLNRDAPPMDQASTYNPTTSNQQSRCNCGNMLVANSCNPCPAGQYSASGEPCQPCPHGTISSKAGSCQCTACPAGQIPNEGTMCIPCPPGTVFHQASGSTQSQCTECEEANDCMNCPCGQAGIIGQTGLAGCAPCPPGYYSPGGATSCQICPSATLQGQCYCPGT